MAKNGHLEAGASTDDFLREPLNPAADDATTTNDISHHHRHHGAKDVETISLGRGEQAHRIALEKLQFYQCVFGQQPLSKERCCRCWSSSALEEVEEDSSSTNSVATTTQSTTGAAVCHLGWDIYRVILLGIMAVEAFVLFCALCFGGKAMFPDVQTKNDDSQFTLWLPTLLGTVACLVSSCVLPSKFKAASDDVARVVSPLSPKDSRPPLNVDDIDWAGRRAGGFTIAWLVMSIAACVALTPLWQLRLETFLGSCAALPTLGALFFVFALDAARVKKEIRELEKRAQDMSLTLRDYERSQRYIEGITGDSSKSLLLLSSIGLYSLLGYLLFMYFGDKYTTDESILVIDVFLFTFMGKEACLFFAFTYLAMVVNNAADDVCTEVYLWPTTVEEEEEANMEAGAKDVLADRQRRMVAILAKATAFVGPRQRKHRVGPWIRLATPKAGAISFRVLGVRWTSRLVLALMLSLGSSLIGGFAEHKID